MLSWTPKLFATATVMAQPRPRPAAQPTPLMLLVALLALLLDGPSRYGGTPCCGVHALLDVRYDHTQRMYRSYNTCTMYVPPHLDHRAGSLPLPGGAAHAANWSPTCGLNLKGVPQRSGPNQNPDQIQAVLLPHLLGQAVDCSGRPATHGRDFFFVELARPHAPISLRLMGQHIRGGVYSFTGWQHVSPGRWNATFVLWASAHQRLLDANGTAANMTSALFDADWQFTVRKYINNTLNVVASWILVKGGNPIQGAPGSREAAKAAGQRRLRLPQCAVPAKGEWVQLPPYAKQCPPGLCIGSLAPLHMHRNINLQRKFRHVYTPWSCTYRLYSRDEVRACLAGKRVLLLGDSRFRHLNESFFDVLGLTLSHGGSGYAFKDGRVPEKLPVSNPPLDPGDPGTAGTYLFYWKMVPDRVGIRTILANWSNFEAAMTKYDYILMGASDHDIADYTPDAVLPRNNPFGVATWPGGKGAPPRDPEADATAADSCYPAASKLHLAKYRPFGQYREAMHQFARKFQEMRTGLVQEAAKVLTSSALETLEALDVAKGAVAAVSVGAAGSAAAAAAIAAAAETVKPIKEKAPRVARVFWVLTGNRPWRRLPAGFCHPDQLDRMLCLHAEALGVLRHSGITPLDLATLQVDAPESWWDDNTHIGKATSRNGLALMSTQALVNALCAPGSKPPQ